MIQGRPTLGKTVRQADLTSECWTVQVWGLDACKDCEFLNTEDCGGKSVREAMLAGKRDSTGLPSVGNSNDQG